MSLLEKIRVTQAFLESKGIEKPEFGLILGSGLGELAEEVEDAIVIDYADIPNWGQSTVVGHAGKLVYGTLSGRKVLALQGRFHFYEGNPLEVVTFPVRVMKALGCEGVVVTNAAGGIGFGPGTLMAITDHINMTGQNPLIGENLDDFGPRFPDMSKAYTPEYRETAHKVADKLGIKLDDGVYIGVTGPTYETPAEIRALQDTWCRCCWDVNSSRSYCRSSLWFESSWYFMYYQLCGWFPRRIEPRRSGGSDRAC